MPPPPESTSNAQIDERPTFITQPRQRRASAPAVAGAPSDKAAEERGPLLGGARSAKFGERPRKSSFTAAAQATGLIASPNASSASEAIKELEFDGRLRVSRGGASGAGAEGASSAEGPAATKPTFEDTIVHSITGIAEGLRSGSDAHKSLVLFEVQQLISHSHSVAIAVKTLVPIICNNVASWSHDLQLCAAEALVGMQPSKLPHEMAVSVIDTAFLVLRLNRDPDMFRAWGEILVSILPNVKWSQKELESILANMEEQQKQSDMLGQSPPHSQTPGQTILPGSVGQIGIHTALGERPAAPGYSAPELAQKLTARIIGPIAVSASPDLTKNVLLSKALELSSEQDVEVRGMVVESMAFIGAAVDIDTVERRIWPTLAALVRDPNARLHAATLRTISRIAAAHRQSSPGAKLFTDLLPPVFVRECQYLRKQAQADQRLVDDDTYLLIEINAEIFGELYFSCHKFLSDETARKDAFRAFQAMATCNGPVVRRHCAFNVPGIAFCMIKRCRYDIATIVEFLARDTDAETRWNLAAGMHETTKILCEDDTMENLFKAVNALLHDESPLVRMNVLQNIDNLLGTLAGQNPYKAMRKLETVFQNLQLLSEGNWRTQELLANQLRQITPLVPPQCIRSNVLPLLYQLTDEGSYTVRKASMAAVAVCLRYVPDTNEREEVMENFRLEWGRGAVFWMRIGFIDSAEAAVETYSRILFRDTFALELLRLVHDPVPNVRIRAAQLIHKIAPACHQMEEFQAALATLKEDEDRDVCYTIRDVDANIHEELEAGKKSFERDMTREAEEQRLYTKHLQLKAEVHKRKGGVKHKTNAILEALSSPRGATNAGDSTGDGMKNKSGRPRLPRGSTFNSPSGPSTSNGHGHNSSSGPGAVEAVSSGASKDDLSSMLSEASAANSNTPRIPRAASVSARIGRKGGQNIPTMMASTKQGKTKSGTLVPTTPKGGMSPVSVRASSVTKPGTNSFHPAFQNHLVNDDRGGHRAGVKGLMVKMSPRHSKK